MKTGTVYFLAILFCLVFWGLLFLRFSPLIRKGLVNTNTLTFIIIALACYRASHFIVFDLIFAPIRNLFVVRFEVKDDPQKYFELQGGMIRKAIGMLMLCPWCTSMWVSLIITLAYYQHLSIFIFLQVLAFSAIASLIETAWMKSVGFPEMRPGTQKEENKNV